MKKSLFLTVVFILTMTPQLAWGLDLPALDNVVLSPNSKTIPLASRQILVNVPIANKNFFIKISDLGITDDLSYDSENVKEQLQNLAKKLPQASEAHFAYQDGQIVVIEGQSGYRLNTEESLRKLEKQLVSLDFDELELVVEKVDPKLNAQVLEKYKDELSKKLININIYYDNKSWTLNPDIYAQMISATPKQNLNCSFLSEKLAIEIDKKLDLDNCQIEDSLDIKIDEEKLSFYLSQEINQAINLPAAGVKISQDEDGKIYFEGSASNGQEVSSKKLAQMLALSLEEGIDSFEIPVEIIDGDLEIDPKLQAIGITELIDEGYSNYAGSTSDRVYNIQFAVDKFNGLIIQPGETFSFNEHIGEVELYTGWKMAKIIRGDKIEDGVGGGVCQVSTTFFRAALNAGLPIIERHGHSIQVSYYLDKLHPNHGLDATIYIGVKDLKIQNDYAYPILMQAYTNDQKDLFFKFYGTRDDRRVEISKPVSYGYSSLSPVYQETSDLAPGATKLTEKAVTGFKVDFSRTITKAGKSNKEIFHTVYDAWPAKYLKGIDQPPSP